MLFLIQMGLTQSTISNIIFNSYGITYKVSIFFKGTPLKC